MHKLSDRIKRSYADARTGQTFTRFEALDYNAEPDLRFDTFTKKLMPTILKSAVMSSNTIIVVPSYFDFVRVQSWMRKQSGMSFAAISECAPHSILVRAVDR